MVTTKLGRSPITKLIDGANISPGGTETDATSGVIACQRYADEVGLVQVEFDRDPGGTGEIVVEGRLNDGGPWGVIADASSRTELDIASYSASVLTMIAKVTIVPQMRVRTNNLAAITAETLLTVSIQE